MAFGEVGVLAKRLFAEIYFSVAAEYSSLLDRFENTQKTTQRLQHYFASVLSNTHARERGLTLATPLKTCSSGVFKIAI